MMKYLILTLIAIVCFTDVVYSQKLQQFTDSITQNINRNNYEKATYFNQLAEKEIINKSLKKKDTLFADYLYAKSVLYYFTSKKSTNTLKESLDIWNKSNVKNQYKIMKIHYFLGLSYYDTGTKSSEESFLKKSYYHFENVCLINENYKTRKSTHFLKSLNYLNNINKKYFKTENNSNYKKYVENYISLNTENSIENFDFNTIILFRRINDLIGQEKILKQFLNKYEKEKIERPWILYHIYYELVNNQCTKFLKNLAPIPIETIGYGEKAVSLLESENLDVDERLKFILGVLQTFYLEMNDNISAKRYQLLEEKYFPKTYIQGTDKYKDLKYLFENEDYEAFKKLFDEYETELKSKNDYNKLSDIYTLAKYCFDIHEIFKKEDVLGKLNFINLNKSKLTKKNQIWFEVTLVDFFLNIKINLERALKICNKYLDSEEINLKLHFYKRKTLIEYYLEDLRVLETANETINIAIELYGENSAKILEYNQLLLEIPNSNLTKIASKSLKIIYANKLEKTNIAANVWYYLGQEAKRNNNQKDWFYYTNKSKTILEKNGDNYSFGMYNLCLLELSDYYISADDFETSEMYLEKVKYYLDKIAFEDIMIESIYYLTIGKLYQSQGKYHEAKVAFNKVPTISKNHHIAEAAIITCDYLINNNSHQFIESAEDFDRNYNTNHFSLEIYLLKYNLGKTDESRNLLIDNLELVNSKISEKFHLLSEQEKYNYYDSFSGYYQFINNYLNDYDPEFIKKFINLRFYSRSFLFNNSNKINNAVKQNEELIIELKNNTNKINKVVENNGVYILVVDSLKRRNREIEKILSIDFKSEYIPTLNDFNNELQLDEAYVEIIRINKQSRHAVIAPDIKNKFTDSISYGAIIIKKNTKPKFILIDDTNRLENEFVSLFKSKLINKQQDTESYHLLFEPIEKELQSLKNIYFVTDGAYNAINIESIYNPAKKQYIIEYLNIKQIQNIRGLIDKKTEFKFSKSTKVSLFGNPDFNLKIENKDQIENLLVTPMDREVTNEIKKSIKISPLRGTQLEIDNIKSILKEVNFTAEIYLDSLASEDNLKNVNSPDILHIATHGYFLKDDENSKTKRSISSLINDDFKGNSYLKSGLLLAGAQNTLNNNGFKGINNGIINAEEVKNLNLLNTELVVLSACETGLGDNLVGQGVIGLPRAFMIAGAKSVIMSLWSISDSKTQQLMTLFYNNMIKNQMTKEEALRQAKLEMKNIYPEPYYWAGFVLLE